MLENKDLEEEKKREELKLQAKKELEDWYKQHDESILKTKSSNRWEEFDEIFIIIPFCICSLSATYLPTYLSIYLLLFLELI